MTTEAFLKLSEQEQLKIMKKRLDYCSHDFQHQEIVEIDCIDTVKIKPTITVWEMGVDGEHWPRFTDYFHQKVQYEIIHGAFVRVDDE